MLVLTKNATTVIGEMVGRSEMPDGAGLRIAVAAGGPDDLKISAVDAPEPGDQIVESEGARVFVAENAAPALDDQALDAHVDAGGKVRFLLAAQ